MTKADDTARVWTALSTVKDPCLVAAGFDLSIVDLGLVRGVSIDSGRAAIEMTFTEPGCPFTHHVIVAIEAALEAAGCEAVSVRALWDPIWTEESLSDEAKRQFTVARGCMRRGPVAGRAA